MTFDLSTGVFKFSCFDAANSSDLWLALADYKKISTALNIPIEIPDYMRDRAEPLREGFKLVADNLGVVQAKLEKIKGLRIGPGEETKLTTGQILWVGKDQASEQFKLFVESL